MATGWARTASCSVLGAAALMGNLSEAHAQSVGADTAAETALAPAAPPLGDTGSPAVLSAPPVSYESGENGGQAPARPPRRFGAMLDLGVPDGIMTSFVFRPLPEARVHAGLGYNGVSPGLRLGGEYLPFGWGPSLGLAYGHYFEGDANGLVGSIAGEADDAKELLKSIGYDYINLRVGMEFGGDRFTFFTRGGISWVHMTIHHFDSLLDQPGSGGVANGTTTITITEDPVLNAFAPTLNLGLIVQL
ncbi:MAG TPA: hypothetical protein VJU61_00955 [Polyangiaceae bacterium]|nr:hypothetical protein [Polyangiaceae bacterium]